MAALIGGDQTRAPLAARTRGEVAFPFYSFSMLLMVVRVKALDCKRHGSVGDICAVELVALG